MFDKHKMWKREEIVELIHEFERQIDFSHYIVNGVQLWPWIRIRLFFALISELQERERLTKSRKPGIIKLLLIHLLSIREWMRFRFFSKKARFLFVGNEYHRGVLDGISYNKFFDSFRELAWVKKDAYLFEDSLPVENSYYSESVYSLTLLSLFNKPLERFQSKEAEFASTLKKELTSFLKCKGIQMEFLTPFFNKLPISWYSIIMKSKLWETVLERCQPEKIFTLCYYSDWVFALNLAANRRMIEVYELQHGPINYYHVAYGGFDTIKEVQDSKLLPSKFLVWDQFATDVLRKSFPTKETILFGHPWLDFVKNIYTNTRGRCKRVLYALQPMSEIGTLFPDFLVRWIHESSNSCVWQLRFHPRQGNEKEKILEQLSTLFPGIEIEYKNASNDPLPVVLANSDVVLTNFSGVVSEAILMGLPSIAIHPIAKLYFERESQMKLAYICDTKDHNLSWEELLEKATSFVNISVQDKPNCIETFEELTRA